MSVTPETPQSRIENWLAAIAGVEGVELEEPQSRIEKWLAVIYEQGGGGGASDHTQLSNRDVADQHPIEAITGLAAALTALEDSVSVTTETAIALNSKNTKVITGTPTALTVNFAAPVSGKDYITGLNFIAGADFVLTENAPEGYSIVWPDTPTWTEGKAYEVIYRCLWLEDGNGNIMISAKLSEADVPQPEVSE